MQANLKNILLVLLLLRLLAKVMMSVFFILAIDRSDNQITLNIQTETAHFRILNGTNADILIEIDPQPIFLSKIRNPADFGDEMYQLI